MNILITGANGGIGREVAIYLASQGHNLVLASRRMAELQALSETIKGQYPISTNLKEVDFCNSESVSMFSSQLKEESPVSGVVLIYPRIEKVSSPLPSVETWNENFLTCFIRPLEILKAVIPQMTRGSKIVIVSGISSVQVFPQLPLSNVIRSAWLAQAKTLAFAYGPAGIHINTVSLGGFLTDRIKNDLANKKLDDSKYGGFLREAELNPLGTYGNPKSAAIAIGQMVLHFSDHMTGANIVCDGGYTRHY